jgi:uncharacterized protein
MDLTLIFGAIITGLALGLTGGGGTLLAMPILNQGVGLELSAAITASLAAVALLSFVGTAWRWNSGDIKIRLALLFAGAGAIGAPLGSYLHTLLPPSLILGLFSLVVLLVSWRMWFGKSDPPLVTTPANDNTGPVCQFSLDGQLRLSSRCGFRISLLGLGVGVLSGLVGVGGGFLTVPALLALTGLPLRAAVGTSLLVVGLIATVGWVSHTLLGHAAPLIQTSIFAGSGVIGLILGTWLVQRLPQQLLRRGFAILLILVAIINLIPLLKGVL